MDENHSQIGKAVGEPAEAGEMTSPALLNLSTALPSEIWDELAEEASRYLELWTAWKNMPQQDSPASQARLEHELLESLSHLQVHSQAMNETIEDTLDLADQLEERDLLKSS